jgi:hypothetical protein
MLNAWAKQLKSLQSDAVCACSGLAQRQPGFWLCHHSKGVHCMFLIQKVVLRNLRLSAALLRGCGLAVSAPACTKPDIVLTYQPLTCLCHDER